MSSLLETYARVAGRDVVDRLQQLAAQMEGLRVVHVNSTREGGGVAEILRKMLPLMRELGLASVDKNRGYPSADFPQVRRAHVYTTYAATWAETMLLDDAAALALAEEFIEAFGARFGHGGYLDRIAPEMLYLAAYAAAGLGLRCEASQYLDWMVTQYPDTQDADELAAAADRMAGSCE